MKVRSRLHRPLPLVVTVLLAVPILATAARPQEPPPQAWEPPSMADWEYRNTPMARAIREADPTAYQFSRALFGVTERARRTREAIRLAMREGGLSRAAAVSAVAGAEMADTAVSGSFLFPVIVGSFAAPDSTRPYNLSDLNDRLWKPDYVSPTMLNGVAQHAHPNGSVHDYYDEVSYGRLSLTGDIYGYVQADSVVAHYVDQNGDEQPGFMDWLDQMIASVDTGATGVDFSQYDGDHDGYVDTLVLVHNLVGAESGSVYGGTTGFWSHRWTYEGADYWVGGNPSPDPYYTNDPDPNALTNGNSSGVIRISDYVMQPLRNSDLTLIDIGVFAHELGHAFGLPDFYDIDGSSSGGDSEGLGHWCLMASGSWRYSYSPAHMSAISKLMLGWITPLEITDADTTGLKIARIEDNEFAVKVRSAQMHPQEYYLIENRQAVGFDQYLHGTGLLIYHVNDQVTTYNRNPNDLRWAVEQADGLFNLEQNVNRGDGGDPWPGTTSNMVFSYESTPSSATRAELDSRVLVYLHTGSRDSMVVDISSGDFIPPEISIGALRNPVVSDHVELYLIATEVLFASELSVNSVPQALTVNPAAGAFVQVADYALTGPGSLALHATGADLGGNSATADAVLNVTALSALSVGVLSSGDGMLSVLVPAGTIRQDGLGLVFSSTDTGEDRSRFARAEAASVATEPSEGRALSPVYWVDVPDQVAGRSMLLTMRWQPEALGAGEMPEIWHFGAGEWTRVESGADLSAEEAVATVAAGGSFQLRAGDGSVPREDLRLALEPNYPNPFNPSTRIAFTLPAPERVKLTVLNVRGQTVKVLAEGMLPAGRHVLTWDGRDEGGRRVASGIYLYVLETPAGTRSRKMTLIR